MKVWIDIDSDYVRNNCWAGAKYTCERLTDDDIDTVLSILEESAGEEGESLTSVNDFFWHDDDTIRDWLGFDDAFEYIDWSDYISDDLYTALDYFDEFENMSENLKEYIRSEDSAYSKSKAEEEIDNRLEELTEDEIVADYSSAFNSAREVIEAYREDNDMDEDEPFGEDYL